jgi:hypothetical protein
MVNKGCLGPLVIGVLLIVCVSAAIMPKPEAGTTKQVPTVAIQTATEVPTAVPTEVPTAVPTAVACDGEWTAMVEDTISKWADANSIMAIDALVNRYDKIKAPYGCGRNDATLDQIDLAIRLGLASQKTAMMLDDKAKQGRYFADALSQYYNAVQAITDWKNGK